MKELQLFFIVMSHFCPFSLLITPNNLLMEVTRRTDAFSIRSYTRKELAAHYRCSSRTFNKWLQPLHGEIGPRIGNIYNPRQVRIIVERLGEP